VNTAVWIASGLLATAYLLAGGTKLVTPKERLAKNPSPAAFIAVAPTAEVLR
jgi:hypothetical protein